MAAENNNTKIISEQIIEYAKNKGAVTFDDILGHIVDVDFPIEDIDEIIDELILNGIIILEEIQDGISYEDESDDDYDRSRLNYDKIFDEIKSISPSLSAYINKVRHIIPPQRNEEVNLISYAHSGNIYARERLIKMFLKIAIKTALWYHDKYSFPLEEAIQDASVGLLIAVDKIPANKKFSAYASFWIRREIEFGNKNISNSFYVPINVKKNLLDIIDLQNKHKCNSCFEEIFCPILFKELCEKLSLNEDILENYLNILEGPISLESLDNKIIQKLYCNDKYDVIEKIIEHADRINLNKCIMSILNIFPDRERKIIILRYGLEDEESRSLEEIGLLFNISKERVRQIEINVIREIYQLNEAIKLKKILLSIE